MPSRFGICQLTVTTSGGSRVSSCCSASRPSLASVTSKPNSRSMPRRILRTGFESSMTNACTGTLQIPDLADTIANPEEVVAVSPRRPCRSCRARP